MAAPKSRQQPFEELYRELETKVSLLEQGGLSLDDSLSAYEEAVLLAQKCQALLETAELRITRLRQSMAGVAETAPAVYTVEDEEEDEE